MDIFKVDHERKSAVDEVVDKIKELLIQRKLKPGDLLPSESVLAESLRVGRGSIREAMRILSAYGIIEVKRGSGTYVSSFSNKKLFDPLLYQILVTEYDYSELLEVRHTLEKGIVSHIVSNASDDELQVLDSIMKEFEVIVREPEPNNELCNSLDIKYHQTMGVLTGNTLMVNMYNFIIELFAATINAVAGYKVHNNFHKAIMSRDEQKALEMLELHTQTWSDTHKDI